MNGFSSDFCTDESTPLNLVLMGFRSSSESNFVHNKQEQIVLERSTRLNVDPGRGD